MLTILGKPSSGFCDRESRRSFLRIGGLGLGGLSLPGLLRQEALAGTSSSGKSVIMVFLPGGPPHQDMVDLKPDAPSEVRGEFSPIPTNEVQLGKGRCGRASDVGTELYHYAVHARPFASRSATRRLVQEPTQARRTVRVNRLRQTGIE